VTFFIKVGYGEESLAKEDLMNFLVQNSLQKSRAGQVVTDYYKENIVVYVVFFVIVLFVLCKCVSCHFFK
jgi:hypothetical protein